MAICLEIPYNCPLMERDVLCRNYFFVVWGGTVLQKSMCTDKTHQWAIDCESLDYMISF
jgi:hypothetical protein